MRPIPSGLISFAQLTGLRIRAKIRYDSGIEDYVTVLTNVRPGFPIDEIFGFVDLLIRTGEFTSKAGNRYKAQVLNIDLGTPVIGGFPNPAYTL